jgi:hypothetical protein
MNYFALPARTKGQKFFSPLNLQVLPQHPLYVGLLEERKFFRNLGSDFGRTAITYTLH